MQFPERWPEGVKIGVDPRTIRSLPADEQALFRGDVFWSPGELQKLQSLKNELVQAPVEKKPDDVFRRQAEFEEKS